MDTWELIYFTATINPRSLNIPRILWEVDQAAGVRVGEWRRKHLETAGDASLWMSCFDKSPDEDKDIDHGPPESQVLHCALTIYLG